MLWGLRGWQTLLSARPSVVSLASLLLWPTVILNSLLVIILYFSVPLDRRYAVLSFIVFSLCILLTTNLYFPAT